jgi:hypothetical protein
METHGMSVTAVHIFRLCMPFVEGSRFFLHIMHKTLEIRRFTSNVLSYSFPLLTPRSSDLPKMLTVGHATDPLLSL